MNRALRIIIFGVTFSLCAMAQAMPNGNYWFLGIGNDQAAKENENLWNGLAQYDPWKSTAKARVRLRDNLGGQAILDQVKYFHDNVKDGDTFVFYYGGHATNAINDTNNDDPAHDEGIGKPADVVSDDQLAADPYFGSFPESSTLIVIVNTCFGGGLIGGSTDLDRAAIKNKHNLLFMASQAEDALCGLEGPKFVPLLLAALEQGDADGNKQVSAREWRTKMEEFWNRPEDTRKLIVSDNLDKEHNRPLTVPEPATALLLLSGLLVTGLRGAARHGGR